MNNDKTILFSQMLKQKQPKYSIEEGRTLKTLFKCGCFTKIAYKNRGVFSFMQPWTQD